MVRFDVLQECNQWEKRTSRCTSQCNIKKYPVGTTSVCIGQGHSHRDPGNRSLRTMVLCMEFREWGHSAFNKTTSSSKELMAPSSRVLPEESKRSLASTQLLKGFYWKKTKSVQLSLSPGASVSSIPCPADSHGPTWAVCEFRRLCGTCLSELWCSQHLNWAPCPASQTAGLPRQGALGGQSTFWLFQGAGRFPPESVSSSPFNHMCQHKVTE